MESATQLCSAPEPAEPAVNAGQPEPVIDPQQLEAAYIEVIRTTHWFVLYGTGGFAVLCILIGAVESLFGR